MISTMSQHPIPRMAEVAKQAGEAVTTVPNGSARQLRGVGSGLIGMLAADLKDNFQLKIALHVEAAASAADRTTLHCQTLGAVERELAHLESFHEMGAEGVIVVSVGDVTAQLLRMEEAGIVSVVVNPKTPTPLPSVGVDDEAGGHLAGNHLVTGTASTVTDGAAVATTIAARRPSDRPDGIITTSDDLALGIMQELASHGISVPGDIAVVGWDDTDSASSAPVALTSVRQPASAVGAMAFRLLWQRIEQWTTVQRPAQLLELFPDLIVRNSSLRA
jgi:LacI family transcriptional regulator, galactose operon repressor